MVNTRKSLRMPLRLSSYVCLLHQELGESIRNINKRSPQYSRNTIWRHATKKIDSIEKKFPCKRRGRPKKISPRDERKIIRSLKLVRKHNGGNFTAKRVQHVAGMNGVTTRTIRNVLNKHGYAFRPARRKGILLPKDLPRRFRFAKRVLKLYNPTTLWTHDISFYLDGKSFVHKLHPQDQARAPGARIWRRKDEGLDFDCTAKANKCKESGRLAHFFVAISYSKGVVLCEHYEHLDGPFFAKFIRKHFVRTFNRSNNPEGNIFVQDGDPSQNSLQAKLVLERVNAVQISIPPRSPDCNPIENFFNLIERKLGRDAVT